VGQVGQVGLVGLVGLSGATQECSSADMQAASINR